MNSIAETKIFKVEEFTRQISWWNKVKLWFKKPIYTKDIAYGKTTHMLAKEVGGVIYVLKIWTSGT